MPEGDSVHGHARRIREKMGGRTITRVAGTEPSVRRNARMVRGATMDRVEAVGKHLMIDFEGGWTLRVHLGMTGRWRFGPPSGTRGDGPAKVVMETTGWSARCFGAPTVHLDRTPRVWAEIDHIGIDLLDRSPDYDEILRRVDTQPAARPVSDVLLDQTIAAGIGNVYRNEVLFEAGIHPERPIGTIGDEDLRWVFERSAAQMARNVDTGRARTTTGGRARGSESFVYGRDRRPCRRCGTEITVGTSTDLDRITYWCPRCQPDWEDSDSPDDGIA